MSKTQTHHDLEAWFRAQGARIREELFEFLRIPSVSAQPEHGGDAARAARVAGAGDARGRAQAGIHPTAGHPVVLGEWRGARPARRPCSSTATTTCSPPSRSSSGTRLPSSPRCATGASTRAASADDKGQLFLHVKAIEAHLALRGTLPVNVIVLAEGEEEVGQRAPRGVRRAHAGAAALRRGRDLRLGDVRAGTAVAPLLAARARLLRDRRRGAGGRPALRQLRRRGGESGDGAGAHPRHAPRRRAAASRSPASTTTCASGPPSGARAIRELPFDEAGFRAEAGRAALGGETGYSRARARSGCGRPAR